ncbi:bleomycin resistance protein [Celeribacter neptunius]|uniref:Bleomycin resistance protein n=1 Tax=Celeribacter neptunius TaxID=588602 RepID=A0A1I3P3Z8_9RHOB|nr:VOC family protein [Celeribacter neptunius]SFJ16254.1 Catechol 2,3-dioxygenase [Celeribacter neptunius]
MEPPLIPELAVRDTEISLAFYCNMLGFRLDYARPEEGFAMLALGEARLMLDQIGQGRDFDGGHLPSAPPFGMGLNLQLRVPALTPILERLARAHHPLLIPEETRWYRNGETELGQRQCVVADPDGYLIRPVEEIGTRPARPAVPGEAP